MARLVLQLNFYSILLRNNHFLPLFEIIGRATLMGQQISYSPLVQ